MGHPSKAVMPEGKGFELYLLYVMVQLWRCMHCLYYYYCGVLLHEKLSNLCCFIIGRTMY